MKAVERWVEQAAATLRPARVEWCDGGAAESARLVAGMVGRGELLPLDPRSARGSYLHRSHPTDVARTEHLTFIASHTRAAAGPTNNWMSPDEARARVWPLFGGAMKGRRPWRSLHTPASAWAGAEAREAAMTRKPTRCMGTPRSTWR